MRVLLVTHYYPAHGGGVEKVAEQLARRIANDGVSITWCASDTDAAPDLAGVYCMPMRTINVVERASGFPYPLWTLGSLRRLVSDVRKADAVHVHDGIYFGSFVASVLAIRYGKRLVVTQHIGYVPLRFPLSWALTAVNALAARLVLAKAHAVAFISPAGRQFFESIIGARPTFHYLANGVDGNTFRPTSQLLADIRRELGFDPHRPLLLFVGRFVPVKRLPIIREMATARPDWQWCVIGSGPEEPATWQLSNVSVRSPMNQPALARFYQAADLLVLPSASEGFPLVVQEAMACGVPACITDKVAAGSTVPSSLRVSLPDNGADTARRGVLAIAEWLAQAPAERMAQRDACAKFASETWSWEQAARTHERWLRGKLT